MKKIFLFSLCLMVFSSLQAQENKKVREIGFTFSDLGSFALREFTFRTGNEHSLWRFNYISTKVNNETTEESVLKKSSGYSNSDTFRTFDFGFRVGREYRKKLGKNIEFRYGIDFSFFFAYRHRDSTSEIGVDYSLFGQSFSADETIYRSNTSGVNFVLGFNYVIRKNLVLGIELQPTIRYSIDVDKYYLKGELIESYTTKTPSYNSRSDSVVFSLMYRF